MGIFMTKHNRSEKTLHCTHLYDFKWAALYSVLVGHHFHIYLQLSSRKSCADTLLIEGVHLVS